MDKRDFEAYVDAFNRRDYETLHERFFAPDVKLFTLGHVLDGQPAIRDFYGFFHGYIDERLRVVQFVPFDGGFFAEVAMSLTAKKALTRDVCESRGFARLTEIPAGATYDTTLFIHYTLKDGKLHRIRCAECLPTEETAS